jgi:amino acid transporter
MSQGSAAPRQTLSVFDATALMVGMVIGVGIFGTPWLVALNAPDAGWYIALWVVGGVVSLLGVLCYAELAGRYPDAGGEYNFLTRAYGKGLGFLFAWGRLTVIQAGIIAAGALHGLQHHLGRLHEDHANAATFASLVNGAGGARPVAPDTNIVMIDLREGQTSSDVVAAALHGGVALSGWSATRVRAVFHLDVSAEQAAEAGRIVAHALSR